VPKLLGTLGEIEYNEETMRLSPRTWHISLAFHQVHQGASMQPVTSPQLAPEEVASARETVDIIKVSARSRSTAVAGAIAGVVREHNRAEVQAIGAGAVNQAIKAVAIARGYLSEDEIDVVVVPFFTEVMIEDQERTAVRMVVEPR
jgi:stage V sporulation protein S